MLNQNLPPMLGDIVVVRGGGDLATGVIQKLARAGMRVVVLEVPKPTVIRRTVSLAMAAVDGTAAVEDVTCRRVSPDQLPACWEKGIVPLLIDPTGEHIPAIGPLCVVDAIIAKRNLGTGRHMAPVTVALGPGFTAPDDVDCVVETMRGHDLGRLILRGHAVPNTGVPGLIAGMGRERVIHAPAAGTIRHHKAIGDIVQEAELLFHVGDEPVLSPIGGVLRGLIADGLQVPQGMKIADVDPRCETDCSTISDKARCLGGAVLEALLYLKAVKGLTKR